MPINNFFIILFPRNLGEKIYLVGIFERTS